MLTESRVVKLFQNIRWGILWGMFIAAGLSGIAIFQYMVRGPALFARLGVTLEATIASYVGSGIIGGMVVGLMRPALQFRVGAVVTAIIVATIAYAGAGVVISGPPSQWSRSDWFIPLIGGLISGPIAANWMWEDVVYPTLPPPGADDPPEPRPKFKIWKS